MQLLSLILFFGALSVTSVVATPTHLSPHTTKQELENHNIEQAALRGQIKYKRYISEEPAALVERAKSAAGPKKAPSPANKVPPQSGPSKSGPPKSKTPPKGGANGGAKGKAAKSAKPSGKLPTHTKEGIPIIRT